MNSELPGGRRGRFSSPYLLLVAWLATFGIWAGSCAKEPAAVSSPPSGHPLDDLVLAQMGDRTIRVRDLLHKIDVQLPAMKGAEGMNDFKQKRQVLQQTFNQYGWVYLAEQNGWDGDPEFLSVLDLSRKFILSNHASKKAVYDVVKISDEQVRAYYDENPDQWQAAPRVRASVILVETQAEAADLARRARAGEDFAELARTYSRHEVTRHLGGQLGTISYNVEVKGFPETNLDQAIMQLQDHEISDPIQTSIGWAIFHAYDRMEARSRAFEEVQEIIREDLYKKEVNRLFTEVHEKAVQDAKGEIFEDAWIRYASTLIPEDQVMRLASSEADPRNQIAYYRALVEDHPGSPLAPQAQFMTGFVLADELQEYEGAREELEKMIELYPDDELVASARWMLDNLGEGLAEQDQMRQIRKQVSTGTEVAP